ncbi:hypothetical protein [Methylobacterium aquaticum]|uniref:hypothetical protein n=1 Tax=Methylobacterium aquaticum TaxID=270351 RepID=UPI001933C52C|nr:hypothetical protein [Methylobacterium aquaticum]QRE76480.1 hypothetical protein F1D61_25525 [Methylobacterium aquaticum]
MEQAVTAYSTSALSAADLNTTINCEPRIMDIRLAEVLGFVDRHKIRTLIRRHVEVLATFGEVSAERRKPSAAGGRPGQTYWLSKKQALFITAKSDTERAALVTVQMVEVFDAVTSGATPPVTVKAHRRARPKPALPAPTARPKPFEPGSDLLRDLACAVMTARVRIQDGEAVDPLRALEDVLKDRIAKNEGRTTSGKQLGDWDSGRITGFCNIAGPACH